MSLSDHPTVRAFWASHSVGKGDAEAPPSVLDPEWLRALCLEAGADDVGFVELERPALDDQRKENLATFPATRALISIVVRMNREPIRSTARSIANLEFHHAGDRVNEAARDIVRELEAAGIRAELHVQKRFPHKTPRRVRSALRPGSIEALLFVLPRVFQAEASQGLAARFHFVFTGKEEREATVDIRDKALTVANGLVGKPDLTVQADSASWLRFLAHERGILRLLLTRKVRLRGRPALLRAFGRCFPS